MALGRQWFPAGWMRLGKQLQYRGTVQPQCVNAGSGRSEHQRDASGSAGRRPQVAEEGIHGISGDLRVAGKENQHYSARQAATDNAFAGRHSAEDNYCFLYNRGNLICDRPQQNYYLMRWDICREHLHEKRHGQGALS
jgi:hypothetical protein